MIAAGIHAFAKDGIQIGIFMVLERINTDRPTKTSCILEIYVISSLESGKV
jgi:hypothetical protein